MIFEVLCERENYECDFESGEIEMKVFYFAKKEKKSRSVFLGLNECEKDENKNFKLLVFESKLRKLGNENE